MDSLLTNQTNHQNMSTSLSKKALFLSFASGFLSLSLEVIYIRLFGFYSGGLPQVFAFTLALFLLAIALGALYGKDICSKSRGGCHLLQQSVAICCMPLWWICWLL